MDEAINEALLIIISSSVSLEAMFVGRLFANGKLTVACAIKLSEKVAKLCCVSDIGLKILVLIRNYGETKNEMQ